MDTENQQPSNTVFLGDSDGNVIAGVVVFKDHAHVTRKADTEAAQGLNRLFIELKAFHVDRDSPQAIVFGKGDILSVQYKEKPVEKAPQKAIRELEEKKKELVRNKRDLMHQLETIDKQKQFLTSIIGFAETQVPREIKTQFPTPENVQGMLDLLGESFKDLFNSEKELEHLIEDLNEEISLVERKLKPLKTSDVKLRKYIEIVFMSHQPQTIRIEVSYTAHDSFWEPVYNVEVPLDLSRINLAMFTRIEQKTGENWNNVILWVSNAIPMKKALLPELQTWYVAVHSWPLPVGPAGAAAGAAAVRSKKRSKEDSETLAACLNEEDTLYGAAMAEPMAEYQQAEETKLPLAFEYKLTQAIDLNSGDDESLLPVFSREMKGEFFHYCVPQKNTLTYLVCRSTYDSGLLAGNLNIHFGGRFVGSTLLTEKKAGEDLLINLGADRGIKVRREKITDRVAETFFGKVERSHSVREMAFTISVENLKEEKAIVRILDSVPISKTDRIQIKGLEFSVTPTQQDYEQRKGVMLWDLTLQPSEVKKIKIKFFVKFPKEIIPDGL